MPKVFRHYHNSLTFSLKHALITSERTFTNQLGKTKMENQKSVHNLHVFLIQASVAFAATFIIILSIFGISWLALLCAILSILWVNNRSTFNVDDLTARIIINTVKGAGQQRSVQFPGVNFQWVWEKPYGAKNGVISLKTIPRLLDKETFNSKSGDAKIVSARITFEILKTSEAMLLITGYEGGFDAYIDKEIMSIIKGIVGKSVKQTDESKNTEIRDAIGRGIESVKDEVMRKFVKITSYEVTDVDDSEIQENITAGKRRSEELTKLVEKLIALGVSADAAVRESVNTMNAAGGNRQTEFINVGTPSKKGGK